jgi:hypothetical protein
LSGLVPLADAGRPRFLTDEDFNLAIVAGLLRVRPQMDLMTLQDAGMLHASDPQVLAYAKAQDRILLSHDVQTMPNHFATFLMGLPPGEHCPGIMLLAQESPIGSAVQWILEIWEASQHTEWRDVPTWLPL